MTIFTWQELQDAIVDGDAVLGSGGYGTVYRGRLRGSTHVAIKCSLEQRLQPVDPAAAAAAHVGKTRAPLGWQDRVRICSEVVQGMIWLHTQQPPILHMDLKTANVLLDRFGTAKVGDVGLAKLKAGTIDTASYMQSSVIMCELLTGKAAMDAVAALEEVFEDASTSSAEQAGAALQPLLDPVAGWPIATAVEFAAMAAACLQPPKRRPDLQKSLQPALEKMQQQDHRKHLCSRTERQANSRSLQSTRPCHLPPLTLTAA
ncbi:hypothetical protein OEZ85_005400 [Tetradesmus obliquus]|uniref:Protein kinase domain-containing protein n=1 Tax=Tetradesmus obliquus TaxID=3088 RepID=A0ABY8UIX0_TETOB|nr:hypothetical protein OEZ85_005400 [Tetradesmus obliquus]